MPTMIMPRLPRLNPLGRLILALSLASPGCATASPLVISSGPLLPARDGWSTRGIPLTERVADTGDGSWLAAWSHTPEPDAGLDATSGRIVARLLRSKSDGTPDLDSATAFPPVDLAVGRAVNNQLAVVRGTGGGWVVWQSTAGLHASWFSSATGRPVGEPLALGIGTATGRLHAAGDGTTAWVGWAPGYNSGDLVGVTLELQAGRPRIIGNFSLAGISRFNNGYAIAARSGKALVTETGLPEGASSFVTRTHVVGATGEVLDGPRALTGPAPDLVDNVYGVVSHGTGWMIVWAQMLTPLLAGRVVYGRVLSADGAADASQPVQALFVEPPGGMLIRGVTSADGTGVIVVGREPTELTFAQAVIVRAGQGVGVVSLGEIQPFRYANPEPALGVGFDGTRVALITPKGNWKSVPTYFAEALTLADLGAPYGRWTVSRGPGLQEEPALAWLPGRLAVAWQQISSGTSTPAIVVRQNGPDGLRAVPDLILPQPPLGRLSSPSLAANGSRLLVVARQDLVSDPNLPSDNPDDVVGVLVENDTVITPPFPLATGPGSQRAARAIAWGDGFCVAWREELNVGTAEYLARIRCTFLNRDGLPLTPSGLTLAAAAQELSSPTLAGNGQGVAVAWRRHWGDNSSVEAVTIVGSSPDVSASATIFPESAGARSPEAVWDGQGFTFVARQRDQGTLPDSLGLARLPLGGSRPSTLPSINQAGREPVLAALGASATAILWLDQLNGADSTTLWMATREAEGTTSTPERLLQGRFDRDTLVARGDGRGRVMVAVHSNALGDEGIRVFILAPGVTGVPTLSGLEVLTDRTAGPWPGFAFRWRPNPLFPARLQSVEASDSLTRWDVVSDGLGEVTSLSSGTGSEAVFRTVSRLPNPQPAAPYYRLRAVLAE